VFLQLATTLKWRTFIQMMVQGPEFQACFVTARQCYILYKNYMF